MKNNSTTLHEKRNSEMQHPEQQATQMQEQYTEVWQQLRQLETDAPKALLHKLYQYANKVGKQ